MKKLVNKCKIQKKITPHSFRRSYATKLMRNGLNIMIIKILLGHNDIRTTQGYMIVKEEDLLKTNPLASFYKSKKNIVDTDTEKNP